MSPSEGEGREFESRQARHIVVHLGDFFISSAQLVNPIFLLQFYLKQPTIAIGVGGTYSRGLEILFITVAIDVKLPVETGRSQNKAFGSNMRTIVMNRF